MVANLGFLGLGICLAIGRLLGGKAQENSAQIERMVSARVWSPTGGQSAVNFHLVGAHSSNPS